MKTGDTLSRVALAKATRKTEDQTANPTLSWFRENVTALVTHVPNESDGPIQWRMKLKARGLFPGTSDWLHSPEWGQWAGRFCGIEWKREGATASAVSINQTRFGRMILDRGGLWFWCNSREMLEAKCAEFGLIKPRGWKPPYVAMPELFDL